MSAVVLKEPYTHVLEHLGEIQQVVDKALCQYALQQAQRQVLDLQEKLREWEEKYNCSYDLFAHRISIDKNYVRQLDADPKTRQWEADLFSWEFYATELEEWRQRLHSLTVRGQPTRL